MATVLQGPHHHVLMLYLAKPATALYQQQVSMIVANKLKYTESTLMHAQ